MIYRYKLEETSTAYLVVEANNPEEASEKISNYLSSDESRDWRNEMDQNIDMHWTEVAHFSNIMSYCHVRNNIEGQFDHDIKIENTKEKPAEKPWSMHIRFEDDSNPIIYYRRTSKEIAELINEWSVNFYLDLDHSPLLMDDKDVNWIMLYATLKCE